MNWFTGCVLFIIIWWISLFAILPIGTRPVQEADEQTGWRGAPAQPRMGRKVLATTILATVLWGGAYWLVRSDIVSFRHGLFALPQDQEARYQ